MSENAGNKKNPPPFDKEFTIMIVTSKKKAPREPSRDALAEAKAHRIYCDPCINDGHCENDSEFCENCTEVDIDNVSDLAELLDAFAAKRVAETLTELEARAVEDRNTWSSLGKFDKANAVDAIVVAIRVRMNRARGKDVKK